MISTEIEPNLPSPTDLAFATLNGGMVEFYAATEGQEAAVLVSLSLSGPTSFQSEPPPTPPGTEIAQLVPLSGSALALVGTFLTLTIESPGGELNLMPSGGEAAELVAVSPGASSSIGQSLTQLGDDPEGERGVEDAGDSAVTPGAPAPPAASAWERFFLGLDQALEQFRDEFRGRILRDTDPDRGDRAVESQPADRLAPPEGPTSRRSAPDPQPDDLDDESDVNADGPGRDEAVDAIIDSFWSGEAHQTRELVEVAPATASVAPATATVAPPRLTAPPPRLTPPLVLATVVSGCASLTRPLGTARKFAAASRSTVGRRRPHRVRP
jgi:hypothetical protein